MKTVIISDLHIDTWDSSLKILGKTKAAHFADFLKVIAPDTETLYIAGDLMDLPPVRGEDVAPPGSVAAEALANLVAFASLPGKRLIYLVGNHDIGISGLRINHDLNLPWLGGLSIAYPRVLIDTAAGSVLLEHGHFYDPSLMLFAGDLMLGTYFGDIRGLPASDLSSNLVRRLQRRDPITAAKINYAGQLVAAPIRLGCRSIGRNLVGALKGLFGKTIDSYTPRLWRDAAPKALADYNAGSDASRQANTVIFGHTHEPDSFTWDNGDRYFNAGTWAGNEEQSTYLEIDAAGDITIHDWINSL